MTTVGLTPEERAANLTVERLRQLVGLVDYDEANDPFPVTALDAVVFVSGNATQSAHFYQHALGMTLVGYSGLETGNRDHKAFVLRSGSARFVIIGPVAADSLFAEHHRAHGDGVVDLALEVPDVDKCIAHAREQGATILTEPYDSTDTSTARYVWRCSPRTGRPGTRWSTARTTTVPGLDHCVGKVEIGKMDEWVGFYNRVMVS